MKKIFFLIFFLCSAWMDSNAQANPPPNVRPEMTFRKKINFDSQVLMTDASGRPFKNQYGDIKGSPFLSDYWSYATLVTKSNVAFDSIKVRLDLYKLELNFISTDKVEMVSTAGSIHEIFMQDSTSGKLMNFRSGYPKVDNQDQNMFYRVLSDGRIQLLLFVRKVIATNKNEFSSEEEKIFSTYEDYYVFMNGALKRIKKDKKSLLSCMEDQKEAVESFLKKNPTNFKNEADLVKLFNYYNSL